MPDLIYDMSRLSTRALNATPNGIDLIDTFLADYFISRSDEPAHTLLFGFRGPRLFSPDSIEAPIAMLDTAWGRNVSPSIDAAPKSLLAALDRNRAAPGPARVKAQTPAHRLQRTMRVGRAIARYGFRPGGDPVATAPRGAVYLNASHYPLEQSAHVAWLEARPDVRPAFFIHDLLPVARPELFWSSEPARHAKRLELLARRGATAIVASETVEDMLRSHMRGLGRADLPIFRANPPVLPMFRQPVRPEPRLEFARYFLVCGTIEPRKNHLLLLEVWRRLVAKWGRGAPQLVIVGKRGWRCDHILEAIADPALAGLVVEVNGLSTGAYRILLAHALALLAPSFDEGFGLPLAEALTSGTPAIASDIPSHREQGGDAALYLDARRRDDWYDAISAFAAPGSAARAEGLARAATFVSIDRGDYVKKLAAFLDEFE
jgi:glycosyltransferase involved in cell wall biosynthesis